MNACAHSFILEWRDLNRFPVKRCAYPCTVAGLHRCTTSPQTPEHCALNTKLNAKQNAASPEGGRPDMRGA